MIFYKKNELDFKFRHKYNLLTIKKINKRVVELI
jgi:hypothetical protein